MAYNNAYLIDTPQFWGTNLPQPGDYPNAAAYLAAVKAAYEADPSMSAPQYAAPSTFTDPNTGQTMHAAGTTSQNSAGLNAANAYNRIMDRARRSPNLGPGVGLIAESRMAVRPEEAQQAYNAYDLGPSGLPERLLNDYMTNLMEAQGMRPTLGPGASATDKVRQQVLNATPGDMPTMPTQGDFNGKPPVNASRDRTTDQSNAQAAQNLANLLAAQAHGIVPGGFPLLPTTGDFAPGKPPVMANSGSASMGLSPFGAYGPQAQHKPAGY